VADGEDRAMTGQLQSTGTGPPAVRWQVFISFANADRDWVEGFLLPAFDGAGVRYAVESQFALGQPLADQFVAAVENSERVLLVISPAFLADDSARRLQLLAQHYGYEKSTWPVLPLILRPVEKLPLSLGMLAHLDATDEDDWESSLRKLLDQLDLPVPRQLERPECPYPGMTPYTKDDSRSFHGRDAEIEEVQQRLRLHPLLLVIGPSGSGKSSLLHAGVEPRLSPSTYRVVTIRPGPTPHDQLTSAMAGSDGTDGRMTLLIVDQLEELFTVALHPPPGTAAQVEAFCAELLRLPKSGRVQCLLAIRADFYPQLMTSPLWEAVRNHRLEVLPLTGDRLREAIAAPAEQVNVHIESALLHAIVHDAAGQPGSLPLIQETMVLLWGELRRRYLPLSAYEGLVLPTSAYGEPPRTGLQVALARRADAAMADLRSDEERLVARRIFLRLVQLMDGRGDVRRRQRRRDLESRDSKSETFDGVLQHLIDRRLIACTTDEETTDSDAALIDLAHEAIITGWPALRGWIAELRNAEDIRRRLEAQAQAWIMLGRGDGGLLDAVELGQAEAWLTSPDAIELGSSVELDELVTASRASLAAARARRARINRLFRVLSAALAVLLVAVAIVAVVAVQQRNEAENGRQLARSSELALTAEKLLPNELDRALLLAQESLEVRPTALGNEALLAALAANPRLVRMLHAPGDQHAVEVLRDGTTAVTGGRDGVVRVWDLEHGGSSQQLGTVDGEVRAVALSPDDDVVLATSSLGDVAQWALATGERVAWSDELQGRTHAGSVRAAAYSPDGASLATGGEDGLVILRDARTGEEQHVLSGHRDWVNAVAFTPDGSLLVTAGGRSENRSVDERILLWDVTTGALRAELPGHTEAVRALAINRDGTLLASAGADNLVKLWSLPTGTLLHDLVAHTERVFDVAFSPDGDRLASAGRDQTVRLWDAATGEPVGDPFLGHASSVRGVAFVGDDRVLTVGNGTGLFLWDASGDSRSRLAEPLPDQPGSSHAVAVDAKGALVATGDDAGRVVVRRASDGEPTGVELDLAEAVTGLAFGPDSTLVTATETGWLTVWDATTGRAISDPMDTGEGSVVVAVSPDGRFIASGGDSNVIRIRDPSLRELEPLTGHVNWIRDLVFRPTDGALVSVGADGVAFLWTALPQASRVALTEQTNTVMNSVDISPDGRTVATGNRDGQLVLWDIRGRSAPLIGRPIQAAHDGEVRTVTFEPSGRWLVSTDGGGTLRLWEADADLEPLGALGQVGPLAGVTAIPDGTTLYSVGAGGVLRWTLDELIWRKTACAVAGRNLGVEEAERYGFEKVPRTCSGVPGG